MSDTPASALCPRCNLSSWAAIGKVLPFWLNTSLKPLLEIAEGDKVFEAEIMQRVINLQSKLGWGYLVLFVQCTQCGYVASATPIEKLILD